MLALRRVVGMGMPDGTLVAGLPYLLLIMSDTAFSAVEDEVQATSPSNDP
jgi:hypothetical protein